MNKIDVSVWGASGYAGTELVGILQRHPYVGQIATPSSGIDAAHALVSEVTFLALPHGVSAEKAAIFHGLDSKVIDLSGDLRFPTAEAYKQWYKLDHQAPGLLPVQYALPEMYRDLLLGADIVSMPGCYPTASLLGALPFMQHDLVVPSSKVLINALSGTSGAGKGKSEAFAAKGDVEPYKTGREHQHTGEIEQFMPGHEVFFSPQVVGPVFRGLLAMVALHIKDGISAVDIQDVLQASYDHEPFVKVHEMGKLPTLTEAAGKHTCHVGFTAVNGLVQVYSNIDNLLKGAASQAVQAFNIMHGFDETAGLTPKPGYKGTTS